MGVGLTLEVPTFHGSLETLALGNAPDVDELANSEVPWTQHVAWGKEVLGLHLELLDVLFVGDICLQELSNLGLLHIVVLLVTSSNHESIDIISFLGLDLDNLALINMDDSQRNHGGPVIVNVGHSDLISNDP